VYSVTLALTLATERRDEPLRDVHRTPLLCQARRLTPPDRLRGAQDRRSLNDLQRDPPVQRQAD